MKITLSRRQLWAAALALCDILPHESRVQVAWSDSGRETATATSPAELSLRESRAVSKAVKESNDSA